MAKGIHGTRAMLSSVLRGKRAVLVNIEIMRAFVRLREIIWTHTELARKLEVLGKRIGEHDGKIQAVFEAIRQLMTPPENPRKKIGFEVSEPKGRYAKRTRKK